MFLPIGDDQEHDRTPVVTYALIGANVAAFVLFCLPQPRPAVVDFAALVPAAIRPHALITSMFLHDGLLHLAGNMLFLWLFGRIVEERIGRVSFALFYFVCGIAAALLHAFTTADPGVPVLGASGAVSGAVGATLVLCPRANIRVFVLFFFLWGVYEVPAVIWIGLWFAEQIYFSAQAYGNVAYWAHIGGFAAGAAIASVLAFAAGRRRRSRPIEPRDAASLMAPRRAFDAMPGGVEAVYLDSSVDSYAVVTIEDAAAQAGRIGEIAGTASRIEATHGVVARGLSRERADGLRRALNEAGIAAALVADVPANHPPDPQGAESVSWDDRLLRFRIANQSVPLPWAGPFLFVAASVGGEAFLDVFVSPKSAFRVRGAGVAMTRVDVRRRSEEPTDLGGLARDVLRDRPSAVNEGVRRLAEGKDLGWLAFASAADYGDYVFWMYNLALSKSPQG